jgi:hypothetical protein
MKAYTITLGLLTGLVTHLGSQFPLQACGGGAACQLSALAQQAVSADGDIARGAITALREKGPAGLDALWETHQASIDQRAQGAMILQSTNDAAWTRLRNALDKVSGQRDDYASHLYWYTDLDQAEAAAKASGKPIVSLRLLGKLDEEFSCANSRFFRTTLYANHDVAAYLRQHFVLHWQSVRPVPRVTIDFGDGRKIEQTITGNSIHYVLAADGQVIDALPGLYDAKAFVNGLTAAEGAAKQYAALDQSNGRDFLQRFHRESMVALVAAWRTDLSKIAPQQASVPASYFDCSTVTQPQTAEADRLPWTVSHDDTIWGQLATLHGEDAQLDAGSRALIQTKNPPAVAAGRLAMTKMVVESPMLRQIRNLRRSISEDTVRNEYTFHYAIHEWLANDTVAGGLAQLNRRIYADLFLTPDSDPWLGLAPADTFTGLENGGLVWNSH